MNAALKILLAGALLALGLQACADGADPAPVVEAADEDLVDDGPTDAEAETCYVGRDVVTEMGSDPASESLSRALESLTRQANRTENDSLRYAAEKARGGYLEAERAQQRLDFETRDRFMRRGFEEMYRGLELIDDACQDLGIVVLED